MQVIFLHSLYTQVYFIERKKKTQKKKKKKWFLPDRESNPGLPRDRRRSSPLDYRGLLEVCQDGNLEIEEKLGLLSFHSPLPSFWQDIII